jgi:hypothetical protein
MEILPGYTRVSEILQQWDRFKGINRDIIDRKAKIGTNVHNAIKAYLELVPMFELNEEESQYFQSFLLWHDTVMPKTSLVEKRFYEDNLKITGCVDAVMLLPGDEGNVIIDWKCSAQASPAMWKLQSSFYMLLAMENDVPNLSSRSLFVQLDKEGRRPKIHEFHYDKNMLDTCVSAVNTYRFLRHEGFSFD